MFLRLLSFILPLKHTRVLGLEFFNFRPWQISLTNIFRDARKLAIIQPSARLQSGYSLTLSCYPLFSVNKGLVLLFILLLEKKQQPIFKINLIAV